MSKGKDICERLKAVRKRIADENGIAYSPKPCRFSGECSGTCRACEAELRYIEEQLAARRKSGLPLKVAGVALGICAMTPLKAMPQSLNVVTDSISTHTNITANTASAADLSCGTADTIRISGIVKDMNNEPLPGTQISVNYPPVTEKQNCGTVAGTDGTFNIIVPRDATIIFRYVGYKSITLKAQKLKASTAVIFTDNDASLLGEITVTSKNHDDVYREF